MTIAIGWEKISNDMRRQISMQISFYTYVNNDSAISQA